MPLGFKISQASIRRVIGVQDPEPDDELLTPPMAAPPPADPALDPASSQNAPQRAKALRVVAEAAARLKGVPYSPYSPLNGVLARARARDIDDPERMATETDLIAELIERRAAPAQDRFIDRIRAVLDSASSLEAAREALAPLLAAPPEPGEAAAIGELLALAELIGRDDIGLAEGG